MKIINSQRWYIRLILYSIVGKWKATCARCQVVQHCVIKTDFRRVHFSPLQCDSLSLDYLIELSRTYNTNKSHFQNNLNYPRNEVNEIHSIFHLSFTTVPRRKVALYYTQPRVLFAQFSSKEYDPLRLRLFYALSVTADDWRYSKAFRPTWILMPVDNAVFRVLYVSNSARFTLCDNKNVLYKRNRIQIM